MPLEFLKAARALCDRTGLGLHLDGARIFNAAIALDVPVSEISNQFDTVSVCMSKGLGAPVGSVLCGPRELIGKARRWRKVLGGGMRQAGMLAAAGLYALQNHVERLREDHENAQLLAQQLVAVPQVKVDGGAAQTNMVFINIEAEHSGRLNEYLAEREIFVGGYGAKRLVTHLDVEQADIHRFVREVGKFFEQAA